MNNIYDIVLVPDPVLKQKAEEIDEVNAAVQKQMRQMVDTMYDAPGIGLAANQVGILNRVLVMDELEGSWEYEGKDKDGILSIKSIYRTGNKDENEKPPRRSIAMANPAVIWESEELSVFEEGCLSIPGQHADIVRPAKVRVKFLDENNTMQEREFEGLASHCVQHEIDHLNGILFIDYLSKLKANMMVKKVQKSFKQGIL